MQTMLHQAVRLVLMSVGTDRRKNELLYQEVTQRTKKREDVALLLVDGGVVNLERGKHS